MRTILTATAILMALAGPAAAQGAPADTLQNDPKVQQSQDPQPTPQGTKSPDAGFTDTKNGELTQLITEVWTRPVDLQGNPVGGTTGLSSPPPAPNDPAAAPTAN